MEDSFEIPVTYKNQELTFSAQVVQAGYVIYILVDLYGINLKIERDDEGNYRALIDPEVLEAAKVDEAVVRSVLNVLTSLE